MIPAVLTPDAVDYGRGLVVGGVLGLLLGAMIVAAFVAWHRAKAGV